MLKSVTKILDRTFENKKPLKSKWSADIEENKLIFYHYQHILLIYDLTEKQELYSFHETRTDKRGLISALKYLDKMLENTDGNG
jgi:hypothetical protein